MKPYNFSFTLRFPTVLFIALIGLIVTLTAQADHNTLEALKARIAPEGRLNVVSASAANTGTGGVAVALKDGETVYTAVCAVCHAAGIAGAPRTGDADAWQARIAKGLAVLVGNAINGTQGKGGVMPARGGNPALRDEEVKSAVEYMVKSSQ